MHNQSILVPTSLAFLLVAGTLACESKPAAAEAQAQTAAPGQTQASDARVAALELEMSDLKAGKNAPTGDQQAISQISAAQVRSLERQLIEARQRAEERRREADSMASMPSAQRPRDAVVEVPSSTRLTVNMGSELATDRDQPGDPWSGTLAEDVLVGNAVVWAAGTTVSGVVAQSIPAGRLSSGNGGLGIRLTTVGRNTVDAGTFMVVGDTRGKRDAKFIGGTAALGALVGLLTEKNHQGDHALGGAAAGAAAGTALAAGTADTVIRIPAHHPVTFSLTAPEQVHLR